MIAQRSAGCDLCGVAVHFSPAVRDHVEEMSDGRVSQPVVMICRRFRKSASDDHPVAVTERAVANDAIDIKAVLPAVDQLFRHRHGKLIDVVREAGDERVARWRRSSSLLARSGSDYRSCPCRTPYCRADVRGRPSPQANSLRGTSVGKKIALLICLIARLVLHIEAARRSGEQGKASYRAEGNFCKSILRHRKPPAARSPSINLRVSS